MIKNENEAFVSFYDNCSKKKIKQFKIFADAESVRASAKITNIECYARFLFSLVHLYL